MESKGCVYVVETQEGVKIGSSGIPESRVSSLFSLHKYKARFHISKKLCGYREAESRAHFAVDQHRIKGEYFKVSFEDAVKVVDDAIKEVEDRKKQHLETMPVNLETSKALVVELLHKSDDLNREVDVTLMVDRANQWRALQGKPKISLKDILESEGFKEFLEAAQEEYPQISLIRKAGQHISTRVYTHIVLAIYIAEQLSPEFHVEVIASFISGKTSSRYRLLARLDDKEKARLREGLGEFADRAEVEFRHKLLGSEALVSDWDKASADQICTRYEEEKFIGDMLRMGAIRDWEHLKELIGKL